MHIAMGNYYYLVQLEKEPLIVANYFKKVLKQMSEPICTFKLYQ
jgi:hypothetical protein